MNLTEHQESGGGHPDDDEGRKKENLAADFVRLLFSKKVLLIIVVLAGIVAFRLYLTNYSNRPPAAVIKTVSVIRPELRTLEVNMLLPGDLEAIEQANLNAHIVGYIKKLYFDEGDNVKKDQVLAEIEAPDIVDEYNKAKADLNLKTITRDRYQQLLSGNVISQQEFDVINSAYAEAKARYNTTLAGVGYTKIIAPFTGSIARRYKYQGDYIAPEAKGAGASIFLLVNEKLLRAVANIPQNEVAQIRVGNPVEMRVDAYPGQKFIGTISRLDALLDESTKTQRVLIDIKNDDGKLRAGMFVSIILQFAHKDNALTLPSDIIETDGDRKFIYLLKDGKATKVFVKTGIVQGERTEIVSGLNSRDEVIQRGMLTLIEGEPVRILSKDTSGGKR